jgi:hypothetical protein
MTVIRIRRSNTPATTQIMTISVPVSGDVSAAHSSPEIFKKHGRII